ncbi:MAG: DUF3793 family protein [Christensenellaceae bacterium]|jgi:hypothetical protein
MGKCIGFEWQLAKYCAPTIAGIKPASLLSCKKNPNGNARVLKQYIAQLREKGLHVERLRETATCMLLMVYQRELLAQRLQEKSAAGFLRRNGYPPGAGVQSAIDTLKKRMQRQGFPHEIGIFLGYPVYDVWQFIRQKGRHYHLCGDWKVYRDIETARETFEQYASCKNYYCAQVAQGCTIQELLGAS